MGVHLFAAWDGQSGHRLVSSRCWTVTVSKARGTGTVRHLRDGKLRSRGNSWATVGLALRPFLRRIWVPWIDAPWHNLWSLCSVCSVISGVVETSRGIHRGSVLTVESSSFSSHSLKPYLQHLLAGDNHGPLSFSFTLCSSMQLQALMPFYIADDSRLHVWSGALMHGIWISVCL